VRCEAFKLVRQVHSASRLHHNRLAPLIPSGRGLYLRGTIRSSPRENQISDACNESHVKHRPTLTFHRSGIALKRLSGKADQM